MTFGQVTFNLTCFHPSNFLTAGEVAEVSDSSEVKPFIAGSRNLDVQNEKIDSAKNKRFDFTAKH
jgi:hypothetical protein